MAMVGNAEQRCGAGERHQIVRVFSLYHETGAQFVHYEVMHERSVAFSSESFSEAALWVLLMAKMN